METVIKAAAVAVVSAVCIVLIKKSNPETGLAAALAASAVICFAAVYMLGSIMELVNSVIEKTGLGSAVFMPILKCAGIAVVVQIAGSLCRDASQGGIASSLELLGSVAALFCALPLISSLLETIGGLL